MKASMVILAAVLIVLGLNVAAALGQTASPAPGAPPAAAATTGPAAGAQPASVLLEKGIYSEETVGDLDAAMKIYRQIVDDAAANRPYVAQATYRLGMCYLKKGDKAKAAEEFNLLVNSYAEQKEVVGKAKAELAKLTPADKVILTYTAATSEDKRSLGGSGHAVAFDRPADARHVAAIRFFGSRYGTPAPPNEDFHVYLLDQDKKVIADFKHPYSMVERGAMRWYTLQTPATEVPEHFYVAMSFNPHQTKGVYLGLDKSVQQSHSFIGLPEQGFQPVPDRYDWMIQVSLSRNVVRWPMAVETVLPVIDRQRKAELLDLDTGQRMRTETFGEDDRQTHQWIRENHLDLVAITEKGVFGLFALDTAVLPVSTRMWDSLTPPELIGNKQLAQMEPGKITPMVPTDTKEQPTTYLFRTREGGTGILQLLGPTEDSKGVKIRYKLLQETKAGAQPIVLRTNPPAFANDVDPNLDKITVTFDRPMMGDRWSFTGGGETFPQRVGEISYDAARTTCTMPVKLQPGKVYWVGVNSPSHKNFKSIDGTPAARYVILFATKSADGKPTPLPDDQVGQAKEINVAARQPGEPQPAENASGTGKAPGEVYIMGDVERPGVYSVVNRKPTLLQMLAAAGYRPENKDKTAIVIRKSADGREERQTLDINAVIAGKAGDILLQPDDLVLVRPRLSAEQQERLHQLKATEMSLAAETENLLRKFGANHRSVLAAQERLKATRAQIAELEGAATQPATQPSDADNREAENLASEAWKLWQERKLAEAEGKFQQAVKKDPTNSNAWNGLGWAQLNQGKPANAKEAFEKAVAIEPKQAAALNGLGWIAKGQGKTDEAIAYWKKAVEAVPTATAALGGLAQTYAELGQYDKAVEAYQQWLKSEPENQDAKAGLKKAQDAAEAVKVAVPAAAAWLKLVDDAQYGESWGAAAEFFRKAVAKDKWEQQLQAARRPLGKVQSRKLLSAVFTTSLPGAPDGQYVVLQFETVFENKKQAVEAVTPTKGKDGQWQVSGYYIK